MQVVSLNNKSIVDESVKSPSHGEEFEHIIAHDMSCTLDKEDVYVLSREKLMFRSLHEMIDGNKWGALGKVRKALIMAWRVSTKVLDHSLNEAIKAVDRECQEHYARSSMGSACPNKQVRIRQKVRSQLFVPVVRVLFRTVGALVRAALQKVKGQFMFCFSLRRQWGYEILLILVICSI